MSRTFRLIGYKEGKPIYTRNERQDTTYHFYRHELPKIRRQFHHSKRMKENQYFKMTREVLNIGNTNGWETW